MFKTMALIMPTAAFVRRIALPCALFVCTGTASAQSIKVTSTAQEVTVFPTGPNLLDVGGNPNGLSNFNCTLGEAILAVNRRQNVDDCKVRDSSGTELPFPLSGPVTIELLPGATYTLVQWGTTLYGPTGLPAIGAATEGPAATAAVSEVIIEGRGATIERSSVAGTPNFRLFAVAGTVQVSPILAEPARETNPLLTQVPGHLLSTGTLVLRDLILQGGLARGGDGYTGGLGAGGAIFNAGNLTLERCVVRNNRAQGGGNVGRGGGGMGGNGGPFSSGGGGFAGHGRFERGGGTVAGSQINGGANGGASNLIGFGGGGGSAAVNGSFGGGGFAGPDALTGGRGGFGGGSGTNAVAEIGSDGLAYRSGFGAGFRSNFRSRFNTATTDEAAGMALGGAVFSTNGVLTLVNTLVQDNDASSPAAGVALFSRNGSVRLLHTTVTAHGVNGSFGAGTALYVLADDAPAHVSIQNSALQAESADSAVFLDTNDTYPGGSPTITQDNVAVAASSGGGVPLQGVVAGADSVLRIGFFGGVVPSAMPAASSALVNAGNAAAAAQLTTDLRGFPRLVGASVDIGAVEREAAPSIFVSNLADAGLGSLRDAVSANTTMLLAVRFAPGLSGVIAQSGTLSLVNGVNIIGPGADRITLAGGAPVVLNPSGTTASLSGLGIAGGGGNGAAAGVINQGTLTASGLWIRDHSGRGVHNSGSLILRDSAISGNSQSEAVALENLSGSATLVNTTIAANAVTIPTGFAGSVTNRAGATMRIVNSTIVGNTGGGSSGGVVNAGNLQLDNSIVSGNSGTQINGTFTGANNLIGTAGGLGSLQNTGGPTPTIELLAGSNALNAGNNTLVAAPLFSGPPITDQRGISFARIIDSAVDIGAFERGCSLPAITPASLPPGILDVAYSQPLSAGSGLSYRLIGGSLPAGLSLSAAGLISGTPTSIGSFEVTVAANDSNDCRASANYTLTISASDLVFRSGFE
jgi:hypothetical protein